MTRFSSTGLIIAISVLAGLMGWISSNTPDFVLNTNQAGWHAPVSPSVGSKKIEALRQRLLQTSYFTDIKEAGQKAEQSNLPADSALAIVMKAYGPFPHIISISRIDGLDTVQLRAEDNQVQTLHVGDALESGWIIKAINSDHLVAQAGSESFSFDVFEHKTEQEKKDADQ
jgi:hypothetical protein